MLHPGTPFPQVGSYGLLDLDGTAVAARIQGRHRDGTALVAILGRDGASGNRIVPLAELGDPTPLTDAERHALRSLTDHHRDDRHLSKAQRALHEALTLRLAHGRLLRRLAPKVATELRVAA